jgi:hypothetical protein
VVEEVVGWLILSLVFVLSRGVCIAEATSRCGHSTVDDAWGPAVASQAKSFLVRLQRAVKADDKAQFASLVHYPIRVISKGHSVKISSSRNLIKKYSAILTSDVRHAILAQSAECLFANGDGIMIGRGQVWFQKGPSGEMKIITINVSAPKTSE